MGSGLDGIHHGLGSAFGIAVGSMIVERHTMSHMIALGEQHEAHSVAMQEATNAVTEMFVHDGMEYGRAEAFAVLGEHLRQEAQVAAYQDTFLVLCGLTLLALPPALLACSKRTPTPASPRGGGDRA